MSKFKVGDEVVLVKIIEGGDWVKDFGGKIGGIYEIVDFWDNDIGIQSLDGSGHKFYVSDYNIKLHKKPEYKTSNRYKLHKYILSTGFTKQDLSLALNKNQSYLATETRESQFINRGDMSDARYKSLRKQVKEAVYKTTTEFSNSVPTNVGVSGGEVIEILSDVEPKEKTLDEKVKEAKEALDTFTAPKPSNNGAFILGLVFFVMLIIFGIGCLIYKAA